MLTARERRMFDEVFEQVLADLPESIHALLEEVPVVVEDYASDELLRSLGMDPRQEDLCGLHSGVPLPDRSVEHSASMPDQIMIFRGPIMDEARWWEHGRKDDEARHAELERQVRITLLHEIGHHFGLDEDDLRRLGYG